MSGSKIAHIYGSKGKIQPAFEIPDTDDFEPPKIRKDRFGKYIIPKFELQQNLKKLDD